MTMASWSLLSLVHLFNTSAMFFLSKYWIITLLIGAMDSSQDLVQAQYICFCQSMSPTPLSSLRFKMNLLETQRCCNKMLLSSAWGTQPKLVALKFCRLEGENQGAHWFSLMAVRERSPVHMYWLMDACLLLKPLYIISSLICQICPFHKDMIMLY